MKKLNLLFIAISLILISIMFTTCDNSLVTALLRGPAQLDSISVNTIDSSGNNAELSYALQPNFASDCYEYIVMIPRYTTRMIIEGISFKGAKVRSYKMTVASGNDVEKSTGEFYDFEYPDRSCIVYLTVEKDGMDTTVYTLYIYRIMPPWVSNITVTVGVTVDGHMETYRFPLSPGYNPINTSYTIGVNYNAESFTLSATSRDMFPGDDTNILITYTLQNGTTITSTRIGGDMVTVPIDFLYDPFDSSKTVFEEIINVTASYPDEDPNPVTYTIRVRRPSKVSAHTGIVYRDEYCFNIMGSEKDYHFQQGEAVAFSVTPPFGYTTNGVTAVSNNRTIQLFQTNNNYSFIMPGSAVVITGDWKEIPKSTDTNVRYVWEYGAGDGTQWNKASGNLQQLIDGYTGVSPNDYEIWIAKGTINPNWAWISGGSRPPWASAITSDQQTWDHIAFVLKNGVKIYGGFAGTEITQSNKNSRNIKNNETLLSGYKDGAGYTRHLVIAVGINQPTILEGVTITHSEAGGRTSNLVINGKSLGLWEGAGITTANCTSALKFSNCTIKDNFSEWGGGVFNEDSSPTFSWCTISNNTVTQYGGAMYNRGASSPLIENCRITGNQAGRYNGGGISHNGTGTMTVVNTLVAENYAATGASGIYAAAPVRLINVTIANNRTVAALNITTAAGPGSMVRNTIAADGANSTVPATVNGEDGITADNRINRTGTTITSANSGLNNEYKLSAGSACINAGDDDAYEAIFGSLTGAKDLDGNNRLNGTKIDIGAFEY